MQVLCCTKACELLSGWNISLPVPWRQRPPSSPLRESERERESAKRERAWLRRSNTQENKQLQYVYSSNPEGRRGPNYNITYIYFLINDSDEVKMAACIVSFRQNSKTCAKAEKCMQKHIPKQKIISYTKTLFFTRTVSQCNSTQRLPGINCLEAWLLPWGFELHLAELAFQIDKAPDFLNPLVQYTMWEILVEWRPPLQMTPQWQKAVRLSVWKLYRK